MTGRRVLVPEKGQTSYMRYILFGASDGFTEIYFLCYKFGHALGLMHEHQSPARGGVKIDTEKAIAMYKQSGLGWDEDMIRSQILRVYQDCEISNYSALDVDSIMHYPLPKEMTGLDHDMVQKSKF